jgi:hypothetical protein
VKKDLPKDETGAKFAVTTIKSGPLVVWGTILGLVAMTYLATVATVAIGRYYGKVGNAAAMKKEREFQMQRMRDRAPSAKQ